MSDKNTQPKTAKASSTAWRISIWFWLDKLGAFFMIDLFLIAALCVVFVIREIGWVNFEQVAHVDFQGTSLSTLLMIVQDKAGHVTTYEVMPYFLQIVPVVGVVLVYEMIDLIGSLFRVQRVHRQLRPLEEVMQKAQAISEIPIDSSNYEELEKAIRAAEPDARAADARVVHIHSGDDQFSDIEQAINNLLDRMQESNRQQIRFVSDASHELRTPIAVIQGYADLLDRWGKDDPEVLEEGITSIRNESQHMKDLVEQLLFLARGDSGRNILRPTTVDLNAIAGEIVDEFAMIDSKHEYVLKTGAGSNAGQNAVMTVADEGMVKQSMRIFVQNAAKYSPEGSCIMLAAQEEGNKVSYYIEDEGKGMAGSDVAHIFERFYRTDDTRNSQTGGTGLGLAIAKWIVDAHKGEISVVSREGLGSRFIVRLPKETET